MATAMATKRKLVLGLSVSVDGFVAGPNGEVDWIFRSNGDSTEMDSGNEFLRNAGAHMMGSRTYTAWRRSGRIRTRRLPRR